MQKVAATLFLWFFYTLGASAYPYINLSDEINLAPIFARQIEAENHTISRYEYKQPWFARNIDEILAKFKPHLNKPVKYDVKVQPSGLAPSYVKVQSPETIPEYNARYQGANAYIAPGGNIYITQGFEELCDWDHLPFLLAHEIGHEELDHFLKTINQLIENKQIAKNIAGEQTRQQLLARLDYQTRFGYGLQKEWEADEYAFNLLIKAGYEASLGAQFFARMHAFYGDIDPRITYYNPHPTNTDRMHFQEKLMEKYSGNRVQIKDGTKIYINEVFIADADIKDWGRMGTEQMWDYRSERLHLAMGKLATIFRNDKQPEFRIVARPWGQWNDYIIMYKDIEVINFPDWRPIKEGKPVALQALYSLQKAVKLNSARGN